MILKYKDNPGRYDDCWWEVKYSKFDSSTPMCDLELQRRIKSALRLYLLPYKQYASYDYEYNRGQDRLSYRCYMDGEKLSNCLLESYNDKALPKYDIFATDLTNFVRNLYQVPQAEPLSDTEILNNVIPSMFDMIASEMHNRTNGYSADELYKFKNYKEFKKAYLECIKGRELHHGSGGHATHGYSISRNCCNKNVSLVIKHDKKYRDAFGYESENLESDDNYYIVFSYMNDELFELIYNHYVKKIKQPSLLDFIAA